MVRNALTDAIPQSVLFRLSLDQLALLFALSTPGVDAVLCGARQPEYAARLMALLDEHAIAPLQAAEGGSPGCTEGCAWQGGELPQEAYSRLLQAVQCLDFER